jgi:chromate transporter
MIYLLLFWTFFKIGLFTIGGGYAMIPLIREAVVEEHAWMSATQFTDFVGIAESTPGPFAVNISTFSGVQVAQQAGASAFLGSVASTLGVILPSVLIILLVASCFHLLLRHWSVRAALQGARPAVVGLLGAATGLLVAHTLTWSGPFSMQDGARIVVAAICLCFAYWRKCGALPLIGLGGLLGWLSYLFGMPLC